MSLQILMVLHTLPLWFLIFALFLPRVALFVLWLGGPLTLAIFLPRILVLYLIYLDQGISLWFIIHLVVTLMVWGGSGRYRARRRHRQDY